MTQQWKETLEEVWRINDINKIHAPMEMGIPGLETLNLQIVTTTNHVHLYLFNLFSLQQTNNYLMLS
jgi:hypothetical protein